MRIKALLRLLFSKKWFGLFVISLLAAALFVRLGVWQLQRLEQRRLFNERFLRQTNQPFLDLSFASAELDLYEMEFRKVILEGSYDYQHEIAIRNQVHENRNGVHLVTPLHILGSNQTILVDRGWVPYEDFVDNDLDKFNEGEMVKIEGVIRRTKEKADFGGRTDPTPGPGDEFKKAWFFVNVAGISQQVPYHLVQSVYIQQTPDLKWTGLPVRSNYDVEISEGPHLGYAVQWFSFAVIAIFSVPVLIIYSVKKIVQSDNNKVEGIVHEATIVR